MSAKVCLLLVALLTSCGPGASGPQESARTAADVSQELCADLETLQDTFQALLSEAAGSATETRAEISADLDAGQEAFDTASDEYAELDEVELSRWAKDVADALGHLQVVYESGNLFEVAEATEEFNRAFGESAPLDCAEEASPATSLPSPTSAASGDAAQAVRAEILEETGLNISHASDAEVEELGEAICEQIDVNNSFTYSHAARDASQNLGVSVAEGRKIVDAFLRAYCPDKLL